jgi:hypothetical protein
MINITDFIDSTNSSLQDQQTICISKRFDEKNIYEKYGDITFGTAATYFESLLLKQFTNSTKSKYDNVIGWIRLK